MLYTIIPIVIFIQFYLGGGIEDSDTINLFIEFILIISLIVIIKIYYLIKKN